MLNYKFSTPNSAETNQERKSHNIMKINSKERDNEQPICIVQILHNESTKDQDPTFYPCGFEIGNLNY
jgi:hypothetical protein